MFLVTWPTQYLQKVVWNFNFLYIFFFTIYIYIFWKFLRCVLLKHSIVNRIEKTKQLISWLMDTCACIKSIWSVVAERYSALDSSSGVVRMWVRITTWPVTALVSLSKTLNHNCFVLRMGRKAVGPVCCVMHVKEPRTLIVKEKGPAPVFLDSRLEHPAGWICARYKSSVLLVLYKNKLINKNLWTCHQKQNIYFVWPYQCCTFPNLPTHIPYLPPLWAISLAFIFNCFFRWMRLGNRSRKIEITA